MGVPPSFLVVRTGAGVGCRRPVLVRAAPALHNSVTHACLRPLPLLLPLVLKATYAYPSPLLPEESASRPPLAQLLRRVLSLCSRAQSEGFTEEDPILAVCCRRRPSNTIWSTPEGLVRSDLPPPSIHCSGCSKLLQRVNTPGPLATWPVRARERGPYRPPRHR